MNERRRRAVVYAAALALAVTLSCDRAKGPTPGEVMLEVSTNLDVPLDLDAIEIVVSTDGVAQYDETQTVGKNDLHLPTTFAIVAGTNVSSSTPAKIDVIGYRSRLPQIVDEAIVTVPDVGIVGLRMPLDYLCLGNFKQNSSADGSVSQADANASGGSPYVPNCPSGETCVAGACTPETVSSASLPAFNPTEVFGGGSGSGTGLCLDVDHCFATAEPVTPASPHGVCEFTTPADIASTANLNVAVVTTHDEGFCLADGTCLSPLAEGAADGWSVSGRTVTLPPYVCSAALPIVVTGLCPSETQSIPVCGVASSVSGTLPDASTDGGSNDAEGGSDGDSASGSGHDSGVSDATRDHESGDSATGTGPGSGTGSGSGSGPGSGSGSSRGDSGVSSGTGSSHGSGTGSSSGSGTESGSGSGSGIVMPIVDAGKDCSAGITPPGELPRPDPCAGGF